MKTNVKKPIFHLKSIQLVFVFCVVLASFASCSQGSASKQERSGQKAVVNGIEIFYTLSGVKSHAEAPTLIFISDAGATGAEWYALQDRLSHDYQVLSFDRPGSGESAQSPAPRTAANITEELSLLLTTLGIEGSYILIGDRLGAFYATHFAASNPQKVSGLVLIKPRTKSYSLFKEKLRPVYYSNLIDRRQSIRLQGYLADMNLLEKMNPIPSSYLPESQKELVRQYYSQKRTSEIMLSETGRDFKKSVQSFPSLTALENIPTIIVHHDAALYKQHLMDLQLGWYEADEVEKIWQETYKPLKESIGTIRIVEAAGAINAIHLERSDIVQAAINDVALEKELNMAYNDKKAE